MAEEKQQIRQIVLDTETTGKYAKKGDKIVEFGAVEMINREITGRTLHFYINPEMIIPEEVIKIHGITNEKVKDCPTFDKVAPQIIDFIKGAEIIAHNADFDTEFLNVELEKAGFGKLWNYCLKITDSWQLSQSINAKDKRHSLDALKKKYEINIEREFHGALLDSQILAEVYLKMTEGQTDLDVEEKAEKKNWKRSEIVRFDQSKYNLKKDIPNLSLEEQQNKIRMKILLSKNNDEKELLKQELSRFLDKHPQFKTEDELKEEAEKKKNNSNNTVVSPTPTTPAPTIPTVNTNTLNTSVKKEENKINNTQNNKQNDEIPNNRIIKEIQNVVKSTESPRPIRKFF